MFTTWWGFAAEIAWKSTVLLIVASAASLTLWRASAALRHVIWTLALAGLLALPMFLDLLPNWSAAKVLYVPAATNVRVAPANVGVAGPASSHGDSPVLFAIWLTGAFASLWRWNRGIAKVTRMRKDAVILAGYDAKLREVVEQVGLSDKVQLLHSTAELVPLAAGIRKPFVLLPASASGWSRDRLRVVLLHEMAHIRRRDSLTQALAELVRCLYWFHPLVWLALRSLRVERERACDDLVLLAGTCASDYASHLLGLVRSLQLAELSPAAVSMAGAHLDTRIRAILNPKTNRRVMGRAPAMMACVIAACLVLPLAAMRPQAADLGVVTGTVYDPAVARVPGASIVAIQTDTGQKLTTTTDQEGKFSIGLPDGPWVLTVEAPGFAAKTVQRVTKKHYDFTLDIGRIAESVTVHGKGVASEAAGPQRVRVGGNVVPPKLVYKVNPEYPEDAQARGAHGEVVLNALISMQGTVLSPLSVVSNPDPQLSAAAVKAVAQWRYQPALLNGEPVETVTTITVNFELEP